MYKAVRLLQLSRDRNGTTDMGTLEVLESRLEPGTLPLFVLQGGAQVSSHDRWHLSTQQIQSTLQELAVGKAARNDDLDQALRPRRSNSGSDSAAPAMSEDVVAWNAASANMVDQIGQLLLENRSRPETRVSSCVREVSGPSRSDLVVKDDRQSVLRPELRESEQVVMAGAGDARDHDHWRSAAVKVADDLVECRALAICRPDGEGRHARENERIGHGEGVRDRMSVHERRTAAARGVRV